MRALDDFVHRDLESYSRPAWAARVVVRNLQWARTQGVSRLVEEHEMRPVHRAVMAARRARWRRTHELGPGECVPVFLVGVPRSGTNMIVRGLATSPEFEVHNEGDRSVFHRYRLRPNPVVRQVVLRSRHRFALFKPLLDAQRIVELMDDLGTPQAPRAIWAYRDIDGRVRSALTKFGGSAHRALRDIAAGTGSWRWQSQGLSVESMELIRGIDWDTATAADGAAVFWYVRNRLFFDFGLDRRGDVLPLSYNALVASPVPTMRGVCDFLGAEWHPDMAAEVDGRALGHLEPAPLSPRIRRLCDTLTEQLDAAAGAVLPASG